MKKTMSRKKYIIVYTGIFILFSLSVFGIFRLSGRSLIWDQDGGTQYYPYLAYMGQYLRETLRNFLHGDFHLKLFDFTIGPGSDIGSVIRFHPLDFLSAFVPVRHTEILYNGLTVLRFYLAGLSFAAFACMWTEPSLPVMSGALSYAFCGYMLVFGIRHPTYCSALIMLPLVLVGAERMLRGNGWRLFSLAVFTGFVSNYYFMYMCSLALFIYALVRYLFLWREGRAGNFFGVFFRMCGAYLLGLGLSLTTLLPIAGRLSSSARLSSDVKQTVTWLYADARRYYRWLADLVMPQRSTGDGTFLNLTPAVIPSVAMLFGMPKKHRSWKVLFALGTCGVLLPVWAYVTTAFSDINNRWIFIYVLAVTMAVAVSAPYWGNLSRRQLCWSAALSCLVLAVTAADYIREPRTCLLCGAVLLLLSQAAVFAAQILRCGGTFLGYAMLLLTLLSAAAGSWLTYSPAHGNTIAEYLEEGSAYTKIFSSEFNRFQAVDDEDFWRGDSSRITSNTENYPLLLGYRSMSMYNSVLSGPLTLALLEQDNVGLAAIHRIQGLDSHTVMEELSGVKYYLTAPDGDAHAPYGYVRETSLSDERNALFVNTMPLPFGFSYSGYITRGQYETLDGPEKEQVLLYYAVAEEEEAAALPAAMHVSDEDLKQTVKDIGIERETLILPETGTDVKRTKTGYKVTADTGSVSFSYRRRAGYEAYLRLEGFTNKKIYTFVQVDTSDLTTMFITRGPGQIYSLNRTDYLVRLGYDEADRMDTLTLTFRSSGKYTLDRAQILYVPMERYAEQIRKLGETVLEDADFSDNRISGVCSARTDRLMMFSIPYSKGWSIRIDGKKSPLLRINTSYMGTYVSAGTHTAELIYVTPGLIPGAAVSLFCLLVLLLSCVWKARAPRRPAVQKTGAMVQSQVR